MLGTDSNAAYYFTAINILRIIFFHVGYVNSEVAFHNLSIG